MRYAATLVAGLLSAGLLNAATVVVGAAAAPAQPDIAGAGHPFTPPDRRSDESGAASAIGVISNDPKPALRTHPDNRPPRPRVCFNQTETRENIALHRLSDPVRALQVGREQGEALSARLCRWNRDEFVYEIHILRRDGRVLRVYMNAQNGQTFDQPAGFEREKTR